MWRGEGEPPVVLGAELQVPGTGKCSQGKALTPAGGRSHLLPAQVDERLGPLSVRRKAATKTPAGRKGKGMELF